MGLSAVVFTGGPQDFRLQSVLDALGPDPDLIVAADSGLAAVFAAGLVPHLVVGDMDSVEGADLERAEREGAEIRRYPADKDATDLEIALEAVVAEGPDRLAVVGSASGRMDHLLGWLRLVTSPALAEVTVTAWMGDTLVLPIFGQRGFQGEPGSTVSLVAQHGDAHGVSTTGLRWELSEQSLPSASTLGISNEFRLAEAQVSVSDGVVAAIIPEPAAPSQPIKPANQASQSNEGAVSNQ